MRPGSGDIRINGRSPDEYFPLIRHRAAIDLPLQVSEAEGMYDIVVRVRGGGITGQADAVRLGVSRALLAFDEDRRTILRRVERKKPGQPKARKRFQFSKR